MEDIGGTVYGALDSSAEGPTDDCVDGDIVAKGKGEVDLRAIGKGIW